jgi:hypothetical protein
MSSIEGDLTVLIPTFTPGMLDAYGRCPLQFRRKYVEKRMPPQDFSRDLACGIAAHEALQWALGIFGRTGGYPIDIRQRVEDALPAAAYADAADYAADVEKIICWVKSGLGGIDETARVLQVERWMEFRFPGCADCPPFLLRHRVDLVMEHEDGALEHRDWKTGARAEVDQMQNVAARIVVKTAFPDRDRILSSTAFLARDIVQIDDLTRDEVCAVWGRMKQLVAAAMAETEWLPTSNALCPWCPLYQNGCPLYPTAASGADGTTDWLEGAA